VIAERERIPIPPGIHPRITFFSIRTRLAAGGSLLFTWECLTSPTWPVAAAILLPRLSFRTTLVFPLRTLDCHHYLPALRNPRGLSSYPLWKTWLPTPFAPPPSSTILTYPFQLEGKVERRQDRLQNFSSDRELDDRILSRLSLMRMREHTSCVDV
jgi:hypothetical protein